MGEKDDDSLLIAAIHVSNTQLRIDFDRNKSTNKIYNNNKRNFW